MKVKGVILAAGYGTRFLPASKTVPKELFPLVDIPAIDFIVREFLDSGIEDILIVTSRRKKVLEDYLDHEMELEWILKDIGNTSNAASAESNANKLRKITPHAANFHFIRQREMRGTADALLLCRSFCGNSPFVVAYPDDLIFAEIPCAKQLIDAYEKTGCNILTVREMPREDVSRYGVIAHTGKHENLYRVSNIVEKPPAGTEPSKIVSFGRYLYTSKIYEALDKLDLSAIGELSQTMPLNTMAARGEVLGLDFSGERYDVGTPFGYVSTIVKYTLSRPDLAEPFTAFLREEIMPFISKV